MIKTKIFFLSILGFALQSNCQISKVLEEWKYDESLVGASIGYCVKNIRSGSVLLDSNIHLSLIPASTMKVFTTATALYKLGKDFRYATKISYTGKFDSLTGVLDGDLIIEGSGDPTLQSEYFNGKGPGVTDVWAEAVRLYGIRDITGRIIGDASFFDRNIPGSWLWEDVSNYYGAIPVGLSYMDNKFTVTYSSGEPGSRANIMASAPRYLSNPIVLTSDVVAMGKEDQAYILGDPFAFEKRIKGSIPSNRGKFELAGALPDPALLCAENLYSAMLRKGIRSKLKGICSIYEKSALPAGPRKVIYTHYSPTLDKIIYYTNQNSNNLYCESLLRTLGSGGVTQGIMQVKRYCLRAGADTTELCMKDASGLSRVNTTSPMLMTTILCKIFTDTAFYKYFNASLPVSGMGVSMAHVGKGTIIENNLRAKTGYLTRVRSYCGYVTTKAGQDLAFSIIFNNYGCSASEARFKIEKFLVALAEL